jgi:hypothetical protein
MILFANASESGLSGGLYRVSKEILTEYDDIFRIGFSFFEGEDTIYPVKVLDPESIIRTITRNLSNLIKTGEKSQVDMADLTNYSFAIHAFISVVHWALAVHSERNLDISLNRVFILERMAKYLSEIVMHFSPKDLLSVREGVRANAKVGDLIANFMEEKVVKGTMPKTKQVVDSTLSALIKLEYLLAREYASILTREDRALYEDLMISAAQEIFRIKLAWNVLSLDEYQIFNDSVQQYLVWISDYLTRKSPYSHNIRKMDKYYFRKF